MDIKNTVISILLGVVIIISLVVGLQLNELKNKMSVIGAVITTNAGQIDTTGWTEDEKMNYEMHSIIPARFNTGSSAGASMVGGC